VSRSPILSASAPWVAARRLFLLAACAALTAISPVVQAAQFDDDFGAGLRPKFWSVSSNQPLYKLDATQEEIRLSKPVGGTFTFQTIDVEFPFVVRGDFDVQIDFRDASINRVSGVPGNQVQLNAVFGSQYFGVVRSDESPGGQNHHVFINPPAVWVGATPDGAAAGTMRIVRTGSTVSGYINGGLIHSGVFNADDVSRLWFSLQNNGTTDATSVTFDNFHLIADAIIYPDARQIPALGPVGLTVLVALIALAGLAALRRIRRGPEEGEAR